MVDTSTIRNAIADAVDLVNAHAGRASVRLLFADDPAAVDFIASSAKLDGQQFRFESGIETFTGTIGELTDIHAELIQ